MQYRLIVLFMVFSFLPLAFSAEANCGMDLRDDPTFLNVLNEAVEKVNRMLPSEYSRLSLLNADIKIFDKPHIVPVSSVTPTRSSGIVAQVPYGCREIIFDGSAFFAQFTALSAAENSLIKSHEVDMLALLLLHELGHIREGHYGAFIPVPDQPPIINLADNQSKDYERAADGVVARILKAHVDAIDSGEADMGAIGLVAFIATLSFEVSANATLDCLFCRTLGAKEVFWDHTHSHENLEYRLLKLNYEISQTETSRQLLEDYEKQRSASRGLWITGEDGSRSYILEDSEEYRQFQELLQNLQQIPVN